jgi:hypothetical protein
MANQYVAIRGGQYDGRVHAAVVSVKIARKAAEFEL